MDEIKKYEPLWGEWHIGELLGSGSTGNVYKIIKREFDNTYISAIKIISIPSKEQKNIYDSLNNYNDNKIDEYCRSIVREITNEIDLLYKLKGNTNIISYEDHMIKKESPGKWFIFIRMEYAESLDKYIKNNSLSEKDIIKIGIDICNALDLCHKNNILHRDIKESNIFVNSNKRFKLGDFSVSKNIKEKGFANTRVGTLNYMPPEVFKGSEYKNHSDLYSLGLVIYKIINNGKLPFMPENSFTKEDFEIATSKRLNGEKFNKPKNMSTDLFSIVLKACEFNESERFQNSYEMKKYLKKIITNENNNLKQSKPNFSEISNLTESIWSENNSTENTIINKKTNFNIKYILLTSLFLLLIAISAFNIYLNTSNKKNPKESNSITNSTATTNQNETSTKTKKNSTQSSNYQTSEIPKVTNTPSNNDIVKKSDLNTQGNFLGNISNDAFAALYNNDVYYTNFDLNNNLYKENSSNSENELITEGNCWNINIVNDWIYYFDKSNNQNIYKIKIDGTNKKLLNSDVSNYINVYEEYIFYKNISDNGYIYKIKTDGTDKTKLNNENSWGLNFDNNWLYYLAWEDSKGGLYKIKPDGTNKTKLNSDWSNYINVSDNWVYYINSSDKNKIYKITIDGSNKEKITDDRTDAMIVYNDWIYFKNIDDDKLYKITTIGTDKKLHYSESTLKINIINNQIWLLTKSNKLLKLDL
jgi:serine/threonine protein kinase